MRHVVYGTAGHIDHGKTALVKALTGVDCDRLPEEKDRGITIDLGFARLEEDDACLHFVDVPGHERLVHTMIAGASGIDLALLVVAADEGIMPQTREHLEVIRLMGVPGGAVALTKIDTVDEEIAELAAEEIAELLQDTAFADAPVVCVSAITGEGIAELRRILVSQIETATPRQLDDRPFRQAVDRVFTLPGVGTVITGTSLWGRLRVGEEVGVWPDGITARARRLHVHGVEQEEVEAGERVAINLASVNRDQLRRGQQVLQNGDWQPTKLVTLRLELLRSAPGTLDEGDEMEIHAHGARISARLERLAIRPLQPGATTVAQLRLIEPMLLFPGDRVVLRRPAPVNTFGGGLVLDAQLPRIKRRDSARLDELPGIQRASWPQLLESWIVRYGLAASDAETLAARLGVASAEIESCLGRLLSSNRIQALAAQPHRFIQTSQLDDLETRAKAELKQRLESEEVSAGIPARDFLATLVPARAMYLAGALLEELKRRQVLDIVEGRVVPAGGDHHMTKLGAELSHKIDELFLSAGVEPPSPGAAAETLNAKPVVVEGVCRFLVQTGRLVRLDGKFLIHRRVLDDISASLATWDQATFAVGEFKKRFGLTRKLAIPILEWLDSERVTVRTGNDRKILKTSADHS
ncbi:MAG: selenocysteine-specific translation elongation factor [bacterium]|nr:selenocysteine-specific translation elongation factor [bacterium]